MITGIEPILDKVKTPDSILLAPAFRTVNPRESEGTHFPFLFKPGSTCYFPRLVWFYPPIPSLIQSFKVLLLNFGMNLFISRKQCPWWFLVLQLEIISRKPTRNITNRL
jgi:hypothetical protein